MPIHSQAIVEIVHGLGDEPVPLDERGALLRSVSFDSKQPACEWAMI
jgi:hypothetical protein